MKTFAYLVRRFFSFGADWYITGMLINLFTNLITMIPMFKDSVYACLIILSFVIPFIYYVIVPYKMNGQTLMNRAMAVRIVKDDGSQLKISDLFIRYFVGCLILEGAFFIPSVNIRTILIITVFKKASFTSLITTIINVISLISVSSVIFDLKKFKILHDRISNTIMIDSAKVPN